MEENSSERPKTKSKHFYDDEILAVRDGVVYLKQGVYRLYPPNLTEDMHQNINYVVITADKLIKNKQTLDQEKDFN